MSTTNEALTKAKVKRKDQHPVRKEFVSTSDTQYKCMYCTWTTIMNATRMVKHIVEHCRSAPAKVKEELEAIQQATIEKERNSALISENKKDIHGLFTVVSNKRICMFCEWSTVRNLTRMRNHIVMQCPKVPVNVRACFLKEENASDTSQVQEHEQDQNRNFESYRVVTLDEDRWGENEIQVLESTNSAAQDESEDRQAEENYLEVQELDERNCSWCGKALTYDSCEVEDESEVYCSSRCFQRHTEHPRKGITQSIEPTEHKRVMDLKRPLSRESNDPSEPPAKEFKLVVVSSQYPPSSAVRVKQENIRNGNGIKHNNSGDSPTMVEVDYTLEADSESIPEDESAQQQMPSKTPGRRQSMVLTRAVNASNRRRAAMRACRSLPAKMASVKKAEAVDEGSCHSFAGGHVYPQEDVHSADHKLQWTKAVISRPAPQFEATAVVDGAFKKIKLSDYRGKYLVFFFYPLDFTFVCPTEILAFSDRVKEFKKLNTEVIAASIDSHFTHLAWINTPRKEGGLGKINIPLVSDITHSIAKDYGVYLDDLGHTLRGLFIIDDRGILRQITMNDLPVGRSVDETLRLVQAFQYTDKHGEVCPAGWKPGQDTIVPNPEEKIKYFEKNH
ncbi:uncharacterized protein LOC131689513 [Topomyia yanbarensis]|uniref:uncharacterized protein LOC131689513 n=1 Tax=Topomyia yanbarensis TaxID=2498891 RepID=UPI00273B804F|nr:uncharacterized protein LOC131689513 [Topomyia yanbarensis]